MTARWIAVVSFALLACGEPPPPAAGGPPDESSAPTRWVPVRRAEGMALTDALGEVEGVADSRGADITSPFDGRLRGFLVAPGDRVTAGAPIAEVFVPELATAAANLAGLRGEVQAAQAQVERLEALTAEGLARADALLDARQSLAAAQTRLQTSTALLRAADVAPTEARALLRRGYLVLKSPVDGTVVALDGRVGSPVTAHAPVARLAGSGPVRVVARSPHPLPRGRAFLRTDEGDVALRPIGTPLRDDDGRFVAFFEPTGATSLRHGERWPLEIRSDGTLASIPTSALALREGSRAQVVRRRDGSTATLSVEVVRADGARAAVRGDLQDGDEVAADPAPLLTEEGA